MTPHRCSPSSGSPRRPGWCPAPASSCSTLAASRTPDTGVLDVLTPREREILALVGTGMSNHEIATRLVLSPLTVKTHVSRLLLKLDARDRPQLVVVAYETGLVGPRNVVPPA
jgi:DNA-binding NarL/FixJ family response regulator